jgi:hypothetical protein
MESKSEFAKFKEDHDGDWAGAPTYSLTVASV